MILRDKGQGRAYSIADCFETPSKVTSHLCSLLSKVFLWPFTTPQAPSHHRHLAEEGTDVLGGDVTCSKWRRVLALSGPGLHPPAGSALLGVGLGRGERGGTGPRVALARLRGL